MDLVVTRGARRGSSMCATTRGVERFVGTLDDYVRKMRMKKWVVDRMTRALRSEFSRYVTHDEAARMVQDAYRQAEAYVELRERLPSVRLRGMREYAISPDACLALIGLVEEVRPKLVVELGSGLSTLALAAALDQWVPESRLISVDHSADYAEVTRVRLRENGFDHAEVRVAALVDLEFGGDSIKWYEPRTFDDLDGVDLLFIDGPPAHLGRRSRWPSLSVLGPRIASRGLVVLDDADRDDDSALAEEWCQSVRGCLTMAEAEKGLAVVKAGMAEE